MPWTRSIHFRQAALAALLGFAIAACGGATIPSATPTGGPVFTEPPALTDAQKTWCTNHTGGPGEDMHQVEDMALHLELIPGAKTREDVFGRWAGHPASDPDITYTIACLAAFAASDASPAPS